MFIDYEKIGQTLKLFFPKHSKEIWDYCYEKKIKQNCTYIEKNKKKVFKKLRKKFGKEPLKVTFYVHDCSKWKSQTIYDLMANDSRFEPQIIVTKAASKEGSLNYLNADDLIKTYNFFKNKNMNVAYGYDIENNKFIPFKKFNPDIIFYGHPWYVETQQGPVVCSKFALTYYVPYFLANTALYVEYDLRFHQYLHKHYVLNSYIKNFYEERQKYKTSNIHAIGHPQLDYFYFNKDKKTENKYVIYAPHWSAATTKGICYSTFLKTGEYILNFAKKHPEINWIFKPHPVLHIQLTEVSKVWTKEKWENYCEEWKKIGTLYNTGDYLDLFMDSYALITDCGSFLTEYFLTKKPVIHLLSDCAYEKNYSVQKIEKSYYQARSIEELNQYLDEIIIKKNDPKKQERLETLKELGLENNYCAKNIINDITRDLNA